MNQMITIMMRTMRIENKRIRMRNRRTEGGRCENEPGKKEISFITSMTKKNDLFDTEH